VVLGCRLAWTPAGALAGAGGRRVRTAAEAFRREGDVLVVASGGRVWNDVVEADGMGEELLRLGVPPDRVLRERCSHTTRENAQFTSALLTRRAIRDVLVVTCDWHAARADVLFRRFGFRVTLVPAASPPRTFATRLWHFGRERVLLLAGILAVAAFVTGCPKHAPTGADAGVDAGDPPEIASIATAEDQRRSADIHESASTSHDVRVRRRAAEALARIADADAERGLLSALEDEDPETDGWGAYGLGFGCKGKEDAHVRALAARAASLDASLPPEEASGSRRHLDPRMAIARAVGRCGGTLAEQVLVAWVRAPGAMSLPAAYGLGDVARSRGGLTDNAASALLDAGEAGAAGEPKVAFLYPFGRVEQVGDAFSPRVIELARRGLEKPSELRSFAIRALARSGRGAAEDLAKVAESKDFSPSERAEASRGLSLLGEAGRVAASAALARLTPDKDPFAIVALGGDDFDVMLALLESLGGEAPKEGLPALRVLATLTAPGAIPPTLARRISVLRCLAAGALANGAYDAEILRKCDLTEGGAVGERAKIAALGKRPLVADRRAAWVALSKSPRVRVREDALEAIAKHPELADAARVALVEALGSGLPGVVATAADIVQGHPDRVMVLSAREIRGALDPSAPPPNNNPSREIDKAAAAALEGALKHAWSEDLVETRVGLLDAAAAVRLSSAHEAAEKACHDPNASVREHALKDLRALGDAPASCLAAGPAPSDADAGTAPALAPPLLHGPVKVTFETDAGELAIVFEPDLAPLAAARFVELARKGFYKGIVVHRVVPGFVAQFGDPGGDGYGGSGSLLRCETSPVPFGALDVGVALSGRDTGSSQLFVTLARYPHLDGEYARVGLAKGDWAAVAEGDVIRDVKVED
jgi:cyclophilin family peptidyl-prolyl cis-trans isomerase